MTKNINKDKEKLFLNQNIMECENKKSKFDTNIYQVLMRQVNKGKLQLQEREILKIFELDISKKKKSNILQAIVSQSEKIANALMGKFLEDLLSSSLSKIHKWEIIIIAMEYHKSAAQNVSNHIKKIIKKMKGKLSIQKSILKALMSHWIIHEVQVVEKKWIPVDEDDYANLIRYIVKSI